MTQIQIVTGSPTLTYNSAGAIAFVESGAVLTKPQGIKKYDYGILTSNAGGVLVSNSAFPINGEIIKLQLDSHNFATAGSLFAQTLTPITETLGSTITAQTDQTVYFSVNRQGGTAGTNVTFPIVNDVVTISGGGLGNTTSGAIVIYYR